MIDDRASSVATVRDTSNLSGLDAAERSRVEAELKSLDKRWAALTGNAAQRMRTLEDLLDLDKQFQDTHEPLAVWLDMTDKKFASLEPKSSDTDSIERLIGELKVCLKCVYCPVFLCRYP